ncbi:MAG: alpha-amylase family glycosyl hydrolase [Candidatus Gastranaerophilales bacterium]|nr:alpha-amylase family glycosyl hydrolase [Candidatus Gastranaerophilales bacterium]
MRVLHIFHNPNTINRNRLNAQTDKTALPPNLSPSNTINLNYQNTAYRPVTFGASMQEHLGQGARYLGGGRTKFTIDAPNILNMTVLAAKGDNYNNARSFEMEKRGSKFECIAQGVEPGDKYIYLAVDKNGNVLKLHDPRSDYLPNDILGFKPYADWAEVIDHKAFQWTDEKWMQNRKSKSYGWHLPKDMVMESVHIGLLGGFKEAKKEIDIITENAVANTVRLMPIGEFYGDINWGYDEVNKFAVENAYGRPEDLKEFVNYAHEKGIRVILDIVPNHFGPYGVIVPQLADIFAEGKSTPWGRLLEFNGEKGKYLKSYMTDMLMNWTVNYHIDGFRLDATHYMDSDIGIKDINYEIRSHDETKDVILYPEDMRISRVMANKNQPKVVNDNNWGYDGMTTFDFYKSLLSLAADRQKHEFKPDVRALEHIYKNGIDKSHEHKMLDDPFASNEYKDYCRRNLRQPDLGAENLLINISNHDEIGNEAGGKRNLVNILASRLGMELRCNMNWQQAQWLTFDMIKSYVRCGECLDEDTQRKYGCQNPVSKYEFDREFHNAYALNKLIIGAMFMHASPKEFFMGDERGELAPFKFFCKMPKHAINPHNKMPYIKQIENDKGYPPNEQAFNDSRLNSPEYNAKWVNDGTLNFSKDFANFIKTTPLMHYMDFSNVDTYAHPEKNILEVKYSNPYGEEVIAFMNFSRSSYTNFKLCSTGDVKLREVLNSNDKHYNGNGEQSNRWKKPIYSTSIDIAPYSIAVFEKIKD